MKLNKFLKFSKIPMGKVLLVTLGNEVKWGAKGGESYVKIHNRRNREALRGIRPDGAVL